MIGWFHLCCQCECEDRSTGDENHLNVNDKNEHHNEAFDDEDDPMISLVIFVIL